MTRAQTGVAGVFAAAFSVLMPAACRAQYSGHNQAPVSLNSMPVSPEIPTFASSAPVTPEQIRMHQLMRQRQMEERFRKIQTDTQQLVKLSAKLATAEQSAPPVQTAKDQDERTRLAAQIEKLSRTVRELEETN